MAGRPRKLTPIHPGEILLEDFMKPRALSINRLALDLHVAVTRISEIVNGRRAISADTALRLARYFATSPEVWINLQAKYELQMAEDQRGAEIERQVQPCRAA